MAGTWLTQEAYDLLTAELADLKGPVRAEIVARISQARDEGDLKENGGYHAAREEQAKNEARIVELTEKLRDVQIGTPKDDGLIEPGMLVTVDLAGDDLTFLLGSREMTDVVSDVDVYSPQSALGAAILGHSVGDTVTYTAPNGKDFQVQIRQAKPYSG
ncbi:MAG: transcription elongation factor GreA [Promicromonosporaceae bacterium]|nr:transcription elongation factor GreA [Promicromonosporaceae bacterium]